MRRALLMLTCAALLAGCETTYKEVPTITAAEAPSSVRFAHGNALMMSDGKFGTVWLRPIRYYSGRKIFFEIIAFNHTNIPINFGTEDVEIHTGFGSDLPVLDFDDLKHEAHKGDFFSRWGDHFSEGLTEWHLEQVARRSPNSAKIWRMGDDQYFATAEAIQYQMEDAIVSYSMLPLQTTTIDPFTTFGGVIYAEQPAVPDGGVGMVVVNVKFAGETHLFRLRIAAEGVHTPIQTGLPAVPKETIQAARDKCETWMWDEPGLPCHPTGGQP